jgi:membrane protease YdiL (CAAX protease family)
MNDFNHTPNEPEQNISVAPESMGAPGPAFGTGDLNAATSAPAELFHSWPQPEATPSTRIPHLGHLALLAVFLFVGALCMTAAMMVALHFHLDGVSTSDQIKNNVHYILGTEAVLYLVTLAISVPLFPLLWNKSFFAGIQWRGATALRLGWRLPIIALGCFVLAVINDKLLPGPEHAPIEEIFRSPNAAWLMFAFGVTFAPFFEEIGFRGFLLPAFATTWDWTIEKSTGKPARPLDVNGHPQWSIYAMVFASVPTSLLFAWLHLAQQGYSLGPFVQVLAVSIVLCAVRLHTRSLAASTLVHACYNFMLFSTMLVATGGFRHFDKM